MPLIMNEREEYRPSQAEGEMTTERETSSEQPQAATEVASTPEVKETALNPRIKALREARDDAERKLQDAILDVETRKDLPAFQKAQELYDQGIRLSRSTAYSDTDYTLYNYILPGEEEAKECSVSSDTFMESEEGEETYAGGRKVRTGNFFDDLYLQESEEKWSIFRYLLDLTEEAF